MPTRAAGYRKPTVELDRAMAWVYILECRDHSYYAGSCTDLDRRIAEHKEGSWCCYTSCRLPVKLVFCQEVPTIAEARRLERRIKGWSRAKKEALIAGRYDLLPGLSRSRRSRAKTPHSRSAGAPFDKLRTGKVGLGIGPEPCLVECGMGRCRTGRGPSTSSGRGPSTSSGRGPSTSSGRGPSTSSGRERWA